MTPALREAEPGRLAIDGGVGWVDVLGGGLVRASTALVPADRLEATVAEIVAAAGTDQIVLEADDPRIAHPAVTLLPPLQVHNSLGRRMERFVTRRPGHVGMYSCGPTVYSFQHLGNMRAYVVADTIKRALQWRGLTVRHVINITDVGHLLADADQGEDKVEEASRREGSSVEEVTGRYTRLFWGDLRALAVIDPEAWPHTSTYVPQMINFAQVLEDHGYGYRLEEGLYFDTSRQADYGELALIDRSSQRATGRVEELAGKRAASDFALWRTFTDGRQRLMQWESPWGVGAPGWHLECSVMSMSLLGEHFDLHTGGVDHRELHHVNEIAQSEAYLEDDLPWVRYWLHNEFLTFGDRKISKSAGDTIRISDLVALGIHPLAYRYLLLQSHYRSQVAFTEKAAQAAHQGLRRLAARWTEAVGGAPVLDEPFSVAAALDGASGPLRERVLELDAAIAEDFQTPAVLALASAWARDPLPPEASAVLVRAINAVTGLSLGILQPADFLPPVPPDLDAAWVEERLAAREAARGSKDWAAADAIRDELAASRVRVDDTPDGAHWYVG